VGGEGASGRVALDLRLGRLTGSDHLRVVPTPPTSPGGAAGAGATAAAVSRRHARTVSVWPMRSLPPGPLGVLSSACSQDGHSGHPPAVVLPGGGLRMSQAFHHDPVMADEVVDLLAPVPPGLVVDATVGAGGHASLVLARLAHLAVLGLDRDPDAVAAATEALVPFGDRAAVRRARFDQLGEVVRSAPGSSGSEPGLSGVLFDLGVSSPQLDRGERGFSYRSDAPLDMRMDPTSGPTAADLVNTADERELATMFAENGEGRFARRIARAIVAARPIHTTGELAEVVRHAVPAAARRTGGHPARRVFQAIRIAVNEESDQLAVALTDALALLQPGGRCLVLAYHSGEDRLTKAIFHRAATGGCVCPPGLPCGCGAVVEYRLVYRGARRPGRTEIERNRRAEPARLRVIERIDPGDPGQLSGGEVA